MGLKMTQIQTREGDLDGEALIDYSSEVPKGHYRVAYVVFFTLGAGFLLPWNAFITAVDYFANLYLGQPVDQVFAVAYMLTCLLFLGLIILLANKSATSYRVNVGNALLILSLLVVPIMDFAYIKGRVGIYEGFYVTFTAVVLSGISDALVQGCIVGATSELPKEYMQATMAGTAASGFGIVLIYIVTLSIFLGYITEDVHSVVLKDWYHIILITAYSVFDLIGKVLPSVYFLENAGVAVAACIARLLFHPLFLRCLHDPRFFRTELSVTVLTCRLDLTNGYFTTVLMIMGPKTVPIQHSETARIVAVLFLIIGLAIGSIVAWFCVI
ncbi:Equilibrative nucleotide transporter 1 [Acorus calamus]|uniref:Equilibrative nucleotide transporter 1 n=1 Tax=Acorus calamus TaxID=4465 RepID=A0AAV9BZY3_ACOCL|nr:Equilibrative nucleotide transporter 1 [Acorus calamus]